MNFWLLGLILSHPQGLGGQWGKSLGDNPAGHCFVSRDLVPINLFK